MFHVAEEFPEITVTTFGSGRELVSFDEYTPSIINERRDPKAYPAGFIVDLFSEITCPDKVRLIDVYQAKDNLEISGPQEQVRKLYTKWVKESD